MTTTFNDETKAALNPFIFEPLAEEFQVTTGVDIERLLAEPWSFEGYLGGKEPEIRAAVEKAQRRREAAKKGAATRAANRLRRG